MKVIALLLMLVIQGSGYHLSDFLRMKYTKIFLLFLVIAGYIWVIPLCLSRKCCNGLRSNNAGYTLIFHLHGGSFSPNPTYHPLFKTKKLSLNEF